MIRKRNDAEGWKRGEGAYSKEVPLKEGHIPNSNPGTNPRGVGKYTTDDSGLRNSPPSDQTGGAETKEIFDNVNRNSDIGKPGPIKYGVD